MNIKRPTKAQYYIDIAKSVSRRATCVRACCGACIIKDDQIVSTGYNGAPRGCKDSISHGFCLRDKMKIPHGQRYELCRSVHSEQNAIINAARAGASLLGGDMYIYSENPETGEAVNAFPCFICKKMLINCGLKKVICSLADGGIRVFLVEDWIREWTEKDIVEDKFVYGAERED